MLYYCRIKGNRSGKACAEAPSPCIYFGPSAKHLQDAHSNQASVVIITANTLSTRSCGIFIEDNVSHRNQSLYPYCMCSG